MTDDSLILAMQFGEKITHPAWASNEYIQWDRERCVFIDELGLRFSIAEFSDTMIMDFKFYVEGGSL